MLSMDHYTYWKEGVAEGRAEGLVEGRAEGLAEGLAKGESRGKYEVAIQMIRKKLSLEMIAEVTNFTVEEVTAIAKEHALM